MKKRLYLLSVFTLALSLRLYPTLISGLPFSADAWSSARTAELILKYSPLRLGDDTIFDGYTNYWPFGSLFGAALSKLTGLPPLKTMAFSAPTAGATAILIFYMLVENLFNAEIALAASLFFGTSFTHAYFTAGVTKETFAHPVYLALLMVFLNSNVAKRKMGAVAFASLSLLTAMAHHLTAVIAVAVIVSVAAATAVVDMQMGRPVDRRKLLYAGLASAVVALYFVFYAHRGFKITLTSCDVVSAFSYQALSFAGAVFLASHPLKKSKRTAQMAFSAASAFALLCLLICMFVAVVPSFTPQVQRGVLANVLPFYVALPFAALGFVLHNRSQGAYSEVLFWLAPLVGLQGYSFFGCSNLSLNMALWVRTPNFLYAPFAVLFAVGIYGVYVEGAKTRLKNFAKAFSALLVACLTLANIYGLYASVSLQERYLGYHWLYNIQEFRAGCWAASKAGNLALTGDMKISHLMQGYFDVSVDVMHGYRYLTEKVEDEPEILIVYAQMLKNGYVIGFHGLDLPENWMETADELNLIYSNELAEIYAG